MAPSAPLPFAPPAVPLTAFLEGDGTVHPSNGHSLPDTPLPLPLPPQPKLPGKSNLKAHSMFGGPRSQQQLNHHASMMQHSQAFCGHGLAVDNGVDPKMDKDSDAGGPTVGSGNAADVLDSEGNCIECKRKDTRVSWTDSHGKDLAEVWEFEPSDTGDSDEESDSDSSQACTCVIQ